MTYFLKAGNRYQVSATAALDLHEELPVGTYSVKFDQMKGIFFLEQIEDFEIKGKVYGDTHKYSKRILDTFKDRPDSTGVMLSGDKGSGKTLLSKMISLDAQKDKMPTIVINQPYAGEEFNSFIQLIEQPTIIIFDEFEKVYNEREDQEKLLTLLDGVYPSKKLFIITCNDGYRVNEHMKNRPGRIFYRIDYKGLENDFIVEYCNDNLKNKTYVESICRMALMFGSFNFDILKALVEEMNRYNESPQDVMKMLNAKPEFSDAARYKMTLNVKGKNISEDRLDGSEWNGNPLAGRVRVEYTSGKDDSMEWHSEDFSANDLVGIEPGTGKFQFANSKGLKLTLVKIKEVAPNYDLMY